VPVYPIHTDHGRPQGGKMGICPWKLGQRTKNYRTPEVGS